MNIKKKKNIFFLGGVQGGEEVRVCERRIEFFVKIQKKKLGGGGVRGGVGLVAGGSGWM